MPSIELKVLSQSKKITSNPARAAIQPGGLQADLKYLVDGQELRDSIARGLR